MHEMVAVWKEINAIRDHTHFIAQAQAEPDKCIVMIYRSREVLHAIKTRGITRSLLARRLQADSDCIADLLRGEMPIPVEKAEVLCEILGFRFEDTCKILPR